MPLRLLWQPRVRTDTDAATVYLDLQPFSVEIFEASDAAEVYLDIQPGSIYLQVDYLLRIVGVTKRFTVISVMRRWAIMMTRRVRWRF